MLRRIQEFKTNLGYIRHCLKNRIKLKKQTDKPFIKEKGKWQRHLK